MTRALIVVAVVLLLGGAFIGGRASAGERVDGARETGRVVCAAYPEEIRSDFAREPLAMLQWAERKFPNSPHSLGSVILGCEEAVHAG